MILDFCGYAEKWQWMYIHDAKRPFPRYGVCAFSQFVNLDLTVARLVDAATH